MKQEINRAATLMFRAGIAMDDRDVKLLANDIAALAAELAGEQGDPAFYVTDAARELERRIGDIHALPGYMDSLRAGAQRQRA